MPFPRRGMPRDALFRLLDEAAAEDIVDLAARFSSGAIYPAGADVYDVAVEAHARFSTKSALIQRYWPSVRKLETDVVSMAADLLHGTTATGNVTTGGTESILLGVKIARDRARSRRPGLPELEMVVPKTAHPAFWKAAGYFGLRVVPVDLAADLALDMDAYRASVSERTVLLVGSAPNVFTGAVDPIAEISRIAEERDVSLHVDGCIGGFFLPFAERLGFPVPAFDFRLPGVTTMSADLHKFGYVATKGASVILSRDPEVYSHQRFEFGPPDRAPGWFSTPTIPGTRTAGSIAAAWAVMRYLGEEGYLDRARVVMGLVARVKDRVAAIEGLYILGTPSMSVFAIGAEGFDIFAVATILEERGWLPKRDTWPRKVIRFMQSPGHAPHVERFLDDLELACAQARQRGASRDADAAYV
jgi:sphinganine-1-phosphate aldolase